MNIRIVSAIFTLIVANLIATGRVFALHNLSIAW